MMELQRGIKMGRFFTLEYWIDNDWYVGRLKEVPGVFSQGQTLKELKENIHDAYKLMIDEDKEILPKVVRSRVKEVQVEF